MHMIRRRDAVNDSRDDDDDDDDGEDDDIDIDELNMMMIVRR